MNVLFLTLLGFNSLNESNIYTDLIKEFTKNNHNVFVISPIERREKTKTKILKDGNATILRLKIGNIQKTSMFEKGLSTVLIEPLFSHAISKYFSNIVFDVVLYSTPPITFYRAIKYVKKRDGARSYLLLKDIFPQNALDMGMLKTSGLRGLIYKYFKNKEMKLYCISDRIGCMSPANVSYITNKNPWLDPSKVEVCPNSIHIVDKRIGESCRDSIRKKYNLPKNKIVYVYGGNLGVPQGIPFIIECLKAQDSSDAFFLIVGDGTEYDKLNHAVHDCSMTNVKLIKRLPKDDYDKLVSACDIGMIFLDYRFTIPNFPSRLLSYMQAGLPVLACTDENSDIGDILINGNFGWWCNSADISGFLSLINQISKDEILEKGVNSFQYLCDHYSTEKTYAIITRTKEL